MASEIGWIDFSTEDRKKVLNAVDALKDGGALDELGIGVVRDSLADWMFPGISTIQTRPKYFITLSQIFWDYFKLYKEKGKVPKFKDFLHNEENRIMRTLSKSYSYVEGEGIIGISVSEKGGELARNPSSIYWGGLKIHSIVNTELSLAEYLNNNDLSKTRSLGDKDDIDLELGDLFAGFGIKYSGFSKVDEETRMELLVDEKHYLKGVFITTANKVEFKDNLLSQILKLDELQKIVLDSNTKSFKDLGEKLIESNLLSETSRRAVQFALNFDFLVKGAHIRFNILLQKKGGEIDFSSDWDNWIDELDSHREHMAKYNLNDLLSEFAPRTPGPTRNFLIALENEILSDEISIERLDHLVHRRETSNKGGKSKLAAVGEEYPNWIGIQKLDYRFKQFQVLIKDLQD